MIAHRWAPPSPDRSRELGQWPAAVALTLGRHSVSGRPQARPTEVRIMLDLLRQLTHEHAVATTITAGAGTATPKTLARSLRYLQDLGALERRHGTRDAWWLASDLPSAPPAAGVLEQRWHQVATHVLAAPGRPSDARMVLALSCRLDLTGVAELDNGETVVAKATGLHPATIMSASAWLRELGVLGRTPGDGERRHRLWLPATIPPPPAVVPQHVSAWD